MTTIILIGLLGTVVLAVLTAVSLALLHAFTRYHFEDGCVRLADSASEPYVQAGYQSIRTRGVD